MTVGSVFSIMLCIILCPVLLGAVQTLTIDSQLGTSIEDCFERYSIGERLPRDAIYRNISELTTRECEQLCKQDKQCQAYEYGVGAKGNATCNLSNASEKDLRDGNLITRHPDYDIYVRRFQCEQSPPEPLQTQFDEPEETSGPLHRPIFRPEVDDSRKPLDDFIADSHFYETTRPVQSKPPYGPYGNFLNSDRPDDFNQKPAYDIPPSYGDHKPPEIPYKPTHNENFHYIPHRPDSHKPDPYDVFLLNDRPIKPDPGFWRPDPYHPHIEEDIPDLYGPKPIRPAKPIKDPYVLEKPVYHYTYRPNKKPNNEHNKPTPIKPEYHDPSQLTGPVGPPSVNKPNYNYNSQYASNYGQSNNDNSVHVEIYDPPRPYKPPRKDERPYYGSHLGYGPEYSYNGENFHASSHNSQTSIGQSSSHYGHGSITELNNNNNQGHNSQQGLYGYGQTSDYSAQNSYTPNYPQNQKPSVSRPNHSSNQGLYESQHDYNTINPGSGQQTSNNNTQTNGNQKPGYANQSESNSGPFTQKPNTYYDKPSSNPGHYNLGHYDVNQGINSKPSYTGFTEHHDSHYSSQEVSQSYGGAYGNYGSYGTKKPYEKPSNGYYPGYNSYEHYQRPLRPFYENDRPRPTHLYTKPLHNNDRPFYEDDRPYGDNKPTNDYNRPYESYKPMYSNNRPHSDNNEPLYSNNKPSNGIDKPSYGNIRPEINAPAYGNGGSSYDSNRPTHTNKPSYTKPTPDVDRPDPNYGNDASSDSGTGYGINKKAEYGPSKPNRTDYTYLDRPDVKPVYENEFDRPSNVPSYIVRPGGEVVTSRPVAVGDYGGASYGRHHGTASYKETGC